MEKRLADWLENASVIAFGVGIFQNRVLWLIIALVFFTGSLYFTKKLEK